MKKFITAFFVTLGVIFLILIFVGIYFYITDPLNLKPLIFGNETAETTESETAESENSETSDQNPVLSKSQEKALEAFGIDPANVPSEITAEQEACFVAELGAERVAEIKAGASPTMTEYYQARDCI